MSTETLGFAERTSGVAKTFIKSVVLVDDRAVFSEPDVVNVDTIESPDDFASASDAIVENRTKIDPDGSGAILDAGVVTKAFAQKGIVCAVLRPTEGERLEEAITNVAADTDLLILDWQMNDHGALAVDLIDKIRTIDMQQGGRMRLIVIYTNAGADAVWPSIKERFQQEFHREESTLTAGYETARVAGMMVTVVAKEGISGTSTSVTADELPEAVLDIFCAFASGLLSNAMMAAITALRDDTHNILGRFDEGADAAFLTHMALIPRPDDAEEYAVQLLLAEIEAHVPIRRIVSKHVGRTAWRAFIDYRKAQGYRYDLRPSQSEAGVLSTDKIIELIDTGPTSFAISSENEELVEGIKGKLKECPDTILPGLFSRTGDGIVDMETFSTRSMFAAEAQSCGLQHAARLQLGSVLASQGRYWICLTPVCDSVRLEEGVDHWFTFVELVNVLGTDARKAKFDLIVPDGEKRMRLAIARKRPRTLSVKFRSNVDLFVEVPSDTEGGARIISGMVPRALEQSEDYDTGEAIGSMQFTWLGELKRMHAQRLAQTYASTVSRIGLDDFDWHRRQFPSNAV